MTTLQRTDPMELARQRVAKGVALLDEKVPGWRGKIDLTHLRMASRCFCVAAQATGVQFFHARMRLGLNLPAEIESGFVDDDSVDYSELQTAWLEELNKQPA
jgi:hypothetical protein